MSQFKQSLILCVFFLYLHNLLTLNQLNYETDFKCFVNCSTTAIFHLL